jgi:hypothetical protein
LFFVSTVKTCLEEEEGKDSIKRPDHDHDQRVLSSSPAKSEATRLWQSAPGNGSSLCPVPVLWSALHLWCMCGVCLPQDALCDMHLFDLHPCFCTDCCGCQDRLPRRLQCH